MLPPTPAATMAFKSPNACNLCHTDKDAAWADRHVRQWRKRDYQAPILYRASLVDVARKRDWSRLSEMLEYITSEDRDVVFATSLIRLLQSCNDEYKWPALVKAMKDPSPLIRSAAGASLGMIPSRQTGETLIEATRDDYRVVRVRAATSLASYPRMLLQDKESKALEKATREYIASLQARPDHWSSHYNLGNYYMNMGAYEHALAALETAMKFEPNSAVPVVNASTAHARLGRNSKAEELLTKALAIEPDSAIAHFNMGLLQAEKKDFGKAEEHLCSALKADPQMAEAAYNLGVLISDDRASEAINLIRKAFELRPNPGYAYTLAFYMRRNRDPERAGELLHLIKNQWPAYGDAYLLLGDIYEDQGKKEKAAAIYREALTQERLSRQDRYRIELKLKTLETHQGKQ